MINSFLSAKHWQLFLLLFGIPLLFQIGLAVVSMASVFHGDDIDSTLNYMKFFPILMIVVVGTLFGWLWSIAIGLRAKVPSTITMKVAKFKIFFFCRCFTFC